MTADLSALIARLEAAEVGSRELDALIWLRLYRPQYLGGVNALEMRTWHDGLGHLILETDAGEERADILGIDPVTTSLDAALALAERVFPGHRVAVVSGHNPAAVIAPHKGKHWHLGDDLDDSWSCKGSTPALALCIAVLKAKQGYKT